MNISGLWDNSNIKTLETSGSFRVLEYESDKSITSASDAMSAWFQKQMGMCKRQLAVNCTDGVVLQAGAMQWIAGNVKSTSNVKGVGDLLGKALAGKATGESAVKPLYKGRGLLFTEPTYKFLLLEEVSEHGGLVITDGMFVACDASLNLSIAFPKSISGALMGGQGIANMKFSGKGVVALESSVPRSEIIKVDLTGDEDLVLDGPYALMWDDELTMTVEKSGKSLLGSAVSGEGFVNVFRGTGSVWLSVAGGKPAGRLTI